jgi:hypothetical protein
VPVFGKLAHHRFALDVNESGGPRAFRRVYAGQMDKCMKSLELMTNKVWPNFTDKVGPRLATVKSA